MRILCLEAQHRLNRLRVLQLSAEQVPVGVAQQVLSDAQRPESLGRGVHPRNLSAFLAVQRHDAEPPRGATGALCMGRRGHVVAGRRFSGTDTCLHTGVDH